ncbi:MAG: APC family permease [Flavobacteriales bacterium]
MAQKYSLNVARNLVIANMIGTGVFTSLGFQVLPDGIPDVATILFAWALGGIIALAGATSYAEVAGAFPEDGGEYNFLTNLYHPVLGIASGLVSIITGFSAAIASLALAASSYLTIDNEFSKKGVAILFILFVVGVQWFGVKVGGMVQNILTFMKVMMILIMISLPFIFFDQSLLSSVDLSFTKKSLSLITSTSFAQSLVWVMFAYSGWNAATYVVGHLERPDKNLSPALLQATLLVTVIYVLLNFSFLASASFGELAGKVDIGNVVIEKYFGTSGAVIFGVIISISLLAGINSMFIAGPRVTQRMAIDLRFTNFFSKEHENGAPRGALVLQMLISVAFVIFSSFKDIVEYIGLSLTLFSMLVVAGVFIIRRKNINTNGIKAIAYPIAPLLYLIMGGWMTYYFAAQDPMKLVWAVITIIPAFGIYLLKVSRNKA